MLRMPHISTGFFCCNILFWQGKHNGFHHIVASVYSQFFELVANFDAFTCIIKICYLCKNSLHVLATI